MACYQAFVPWSSVKLIHMMSLSLLCLAMLSTVYIAMISTVYVAILSTVYIAMLSTVYIGLLMSEKIKYSRTWVFCCTLGPLDGFYINRGPCFYITKIHQTVVYCHIKHSNTTYMHSSVSVMLIVSTNTILS